jgi:Ran GTPase-activating protein (RanGAP) involved in mRNA processing and transport
LNLSNNRVCGVWVEYGTQKGEYNVEGINAIADALRVNGALTSIDLSGNQLCGIWTDWRGDQHGTYTTEGIIAIANAIRVNGALTKMSLAQNKLGEEGTKAICEALKQNKALKEFDLSGYNNIGGEAGAKHVADMLGVNGALTSINLSNNVLCGVDNQGWGTYTTEGITAIANALRVNGGLTSIDLSGNQLCGIRTVWDLIDEDEYGHSTRGTYTAKGITAIADALRVNGALTKCDLRGNEMGEEGNASIRDAVRGKTRFMLHM